MLGLRSSKIYTFVLLLLLPTACVSKGIPEDLNVNADTPRARAVGRDDKQRDHVAWKRNYSRIQTARELERKATTTQDPRMAALHGQRVVALLQEVIRDDGASEDLVAVAQKMLVKRSGTTQVSAPNGVHRRAEWRSHTPKLSRLNVVGGPWEKITIHHSDEVGNLVFDGTFAQSAAALRSIQRQHLEGNAWGDIGYHFLVDGRGRVFEGRSLEWQGAHAGDSSKNRRNIGICLLGNFDKSHPSNEAQASLRKLLEDLRREHRISKGKIYLHSEFKTTSCPGRHLTQWVKSYRS